jgi:hypothetical protein
MVGKIKVKAMALYDNGVVTVECKDRNVFH